MNDNELNYLVALISALTFDYYLESLIIRNGQLERADNRIDLTYQDIALDGSFLVELSDWIIVDSNICFN